MGECDRRSLGEGEGRGIEEIEEDGGKNGKRARGAGFIVVQAARGGAIPEAGFIEIEVQNRKRFTVRPFGIPVESNGPDAGKPSRSDWK